MAISILIFATFSIYMVLKNYKSSYVRWLFIITISLCVTILSLLTYISKYVNYYSKLSVNIKHNFILITDYLIWVRLFNIGLSANELSRLINIGSAIFIYSTIGFAIVYTSKRITPNTIVKIILLAILPLELIIFYDPSVSFHLFLLVNNYNSSFINSQFSLNSIKALHFFNYVWINIYFLYALAIIIKSYFNTKVTIKKNQILFVISELIPISMIFLFIFVWISIKEVDIYKFSIRLSFIPSAFRIPYYYFDFMPVMVIIFICINIYILARYQILNSLERNQQKLFKKSMRAANQNVKVIFHSFRNYFFAIKLLSDKIQSDSCGRGESVGIAREISSMCEEYMGKINILHSRLKDINMDPESVNLVEVIDDTLKSVMVPSGINVTYNHKYDKILAYIDKFHFVEAVRNIITNAVEAIKIKGIEDGLIVISLNTENEWGIIQIHDNGVGISSDNLKNIFKPFFTTKNTKNNWGVGLSYTQTVIIGHGGCINVKSESNTGTEFEIIIPIRNEEL